MNARDRAEYLVAAGYLSSEEAADPRLVAAAEKHAANVEKSGSIQSPRSDLVQRGTMAARGLERRLEGSPAGAMFPSGVLDLVETINNPEGEPSASQVALAGLEVGLPGVAGKAASNTLRKLSDFLRQSLNTGTISKPRYDYLVEEVQQRMRAGESVDDIAKMPIFSEYMEYGSQGLPVGAIDEIPNRSGLIDELTETARNLSGVKSSPPAGKPSATFVTGPPASGKSAIADPIARAQGAAIPDPDEAKKRLPLFFKGEGANATHLQSKNLNDEGVMGLLTDAKENLVIPTVGDDAEKLRKKASRLKDQGYDVNLVNMAVTPEEAQKRALLRAAATGRYIPNDVIKGYGKKPAEAYDSLVGDPLFSGFARVDNMGPKDAPKAVLDDPTGLLSDIFAESMP